MFAENVHNIDTIMKHIVIPNICCIKLSIARSFHYISFLNSISDNWQRFTHDNLTISFKTAFGANDNDDQSATY